MSARSCFLHLGRKDPGVGALWWPAMERLMASFDGSRALFRLTVVPAARCLLLLVVGLAHGAGATAGPLDEGRTALESGAFADALGLFEAAETGGDAAPDEALFWQGVALNRLGRHEAALARLEAAAAAGYDTQALAYERGRAHFAIGRYEDAIDALATYEQALGLSIAGQPGETQAAGRDALRRSMATLGGRGPADVKGWRGVRWGMALENALALFGDAHIHQETRTQISNCYFKYAVPTEIFDELWQAWLCEDEDKRVVAVEIESGASTQAERLAWELGLAYGPAHYVWEGCFASGSTMSQYSWRFPTTTISLNRRDGTGWAALRYERSSDTPPAGPGSCVGGTISTQAESLGGQNGD
jgi:hypothetical protein